MIKANRFHKHVTHFFHKAHEVDKNRKLVRMYHLLDSEGISIQWWPEQCTSLLSRQTNTTAT